MFCALEEQLFDLKPSGSFLSHVESPFFAFVWALDCVTNSQCSVLNVFLFFFGSDKTYVESVVSFLHEVVPQVCAVAVECDS